MDFRSQKGVEKSGAQLGGLTAAAGILSFGGAKKLWRNTGKLLFCNFNVLTTYFRAVFDPCIRRTEIRATPHQEASPRPGFSIPKKGLANFDAQY
jgi:hypothetical protein